MAFELCPPDNECRRGVTNGPVLVFLGRDAFRGPPQIKDCDVFYINPYPSGFFACLPPETIAGFVAQCPRERILFFNVAHLQDAPDPEPVRFFNVASCSDEIGLGEACGTILYFNVGEFVEEAPPEPVMFFNVSHLDSMCFPGD